MRAIDIIHKKRDGKILRDEEMAQLVKGYVLGEVPDYQMSAFLMAVFFKGMTSEETASLTMHMARSGDMVDLSMIDGIKVDKHSTGGVGDKTSLIALPIAAACGVKVAKMSGKGLGHTGGTIDKLESIPGFRTEINQEEFLNIVRETGISIIGQSGNICPADKKIYALRDVTATVESIPLIASSIMSKKIAAGADKILLDVKTGSGAFMKTEEDSIALAKEMVEIGRNVGRKTTALITDMDTPLGRNIGNALEVIEAVETLNGRGPSDLTEICISIAGNMIYLADIAETAEIGKELAEAAIKNGNALKKLTEMVDRQGGDSSYIRDTGKFTVSLVSYEVKAAEDGYISGIDTEKCGIAAMVLGAGRETKDSKIDYGAGIIIKKTKGDFAVKGETLAVLYGSTEEQIKSAEKLYTEAIKITKNEPAGRPIILKIIS